MMTVEVDGVEYRISFWHKRWEPELPMSTPPVHGYTACFVEKVEPKELDVVERGVALGEAMCSVHDNFSRPIGREISLSRALVKAFPSKKSYDADGKRIPAPDPNKDIRRYIWNKYFMNWGVVWQSEPVSVV